MNKYKIIYDNLKKKVGSDPVRIIVYDVYCYDLKKEIKRMKLWNPYYEAFKIIDDKWVKIKGYDYNQKSIDNIREKSDCLMKWLLDLFEFGNKSEYNLYKIDTYMNRKQIRLFKWDINKTF